MLIRDKMTAREYIIYNKNKEKWSMVMMTGVKNGNKNMHVIVPDDSVVRSYRIIVMSEMSN